MPHFDEMTCMQYLDGQLDRARAAELAAHAESCAECRRMLAALEHETRLLCEALGEEDEPVPARLLAPPAREKASWAWITALGFAAAGAYWFWVETVEPWYQQFDQVGFGQGNLLTLLFFGGVFWKGWGDMLNLVQILATGTLVILGLVMLTRLGRRWTTVAMVMSAMLAALVLPPGAAAADLRKGKQTFVLTESEVIKNDLILAAGMAKIDGTVEGDLIVFCQSLTINGHVTGDVIGFAQSVRVDGTVDGNVRVFANNLTVSGSVAKNLMTFAESLELSSKAQVGGGAILFAASNTLDGRIGRDVLAFAARSYLNGFIGGDAQLNGERLSIGATAEVLGKTKFRGHKKPEVEQGAKLASPLEFEQIKRTPDYASWRFYWRQALRWGAAFVLGLVLALVFPGFLRDTTHAGNRPGASVVAGLIALFLVPVVAIIACITLVGLAVGIIGILLWAALIYAAQVFLGAWLGSKMLGESEGTGATLARLAVGLLAIRVAGNIPYVGGWVWFVVILLGMGVALLTIYERMKAKPLAASV